ncbi:MAG: FAD-binding oxidoreductase [Chitinophagaceae bacterium]|nr:MAG: FAD-binding oxidoreductase [Chitinophagaceae bacterium]
MKKKIANWGNYPVMEAEEYSFSSTKDLSRLLPDNRASYIPRGNGRCYGDASLGEKIISTLAFDHMISFDHVLGILECESGVTLDQILEVIVPKGWFLPVTPGTKFITVGGAIASDVHGKNHHVEGSFSNHIIDMDIMLASGEIITCSENFNREVFEISCGGMGLSGIILRAKFKLKKITSSLIRQTQIKAYDLHELLELFREYKSHPYTMAWIDCLKGGDQFGRGILMAGEHADREELTEKQQKYPLAASNDTLFTFPGNLPSFLLNEYSVKSFNYFYYHKNIKKITNNTVPYDPFFFPLDKILKWNRGYGKKGFLQYQFVLPMENSERGMTDILHRIHSKEMGSFLAVFKVFGKQSRLISFAMEGCTLALDFPIRRGLFSFLDELDKVILDYGGRLYLTKDARMKPDIFWNSYPGVQEFYELIKKYNPDYKFRSLQSDRLGITSVK